MKVAFADPLLQQFVNGDPRALDAFKLVSAQDVLQKYGTNPNQTMSDVQALPMELAMGEAQKKFGKVDLNPIGGNVIGDWYVWTAGQVTIGKHESSDGSVSNESEALNLAIGMDKSDADSILGFAVNGSKDTTDIGTDGSKQKSYGLSLSIYSGINTEALPPMEFILGAGHMNISSTRIDGSQTLTGSRDAKTIFGSIGILSEAIERGKATITPYSKLEAAYIDLGGYSETGGNLALAYEKQIVKQAMVKLGVDASYDATLANGNLTPFTRLEYAYDISPSSNADMHYVGDGTNYRLTNDKNAMSIWSARIGADYIHSSGASTSFYYERSESINSGYSDSIQLKLSVPF
ncbi:MAG: autotransporter outer membrane beta-barrel domain-containing protein [Oceanospirillales bacterium]|nr:autotransporter outer membrane beta-barrel domain-containing protein [Oceanospirillales bacterium]